MNHLERVGYKIETLLPQFYLSQHTNHVYVTTSGKGFLGGKGHLSSL